MDFWSMVLSIVSPAFLLGFVFGRDHGLRVARYWQYRGVPPEDWPPQFILSDPSRPAREGE